MLEIDIRSVVPPRFRGPISLEEINSNHFPATCTLFVCVAPMISCISIGRMSDFVFYPMLKGLCIFKPVLSRQPQSDVVLDFRKCQRIMLGSQNMSAMRVSNSVYSPRSTTKGGRV